MPEAPSLIIATPRRLMVRLRVESGARALAVAEDASQEQGRVRWIPLADAEPESGAEGSDADWGLRMRSIAGSPQAPLVVLWVARAPGEANRFLAEMAALGARMRRSLQRDRVPPRVAAIVYVAESGLDESDALALETIACAGRNLAADHAALPEGLRELLGPRGRPVYLMNRRTRVGADGTSWDVRDVWPVEVGRLLASLEGADLRQPGLRAWRSFRFNPTRYPFERIEVEAFRFAREALGGAPGDGAPIREGTGRSAPIARAPGSSVPTDRSPQHCMDRLHRATDRLVVPDWWDLDEGASSASVQLRTETFGGTGGPGSRWSQRFAERGALFVDDRRERSLETVDEMIGPKSVSARAWGAIHDDPSMANWFASGQFYAGPDPATDGPGDGLRGWRELSAIERRVIAARSRALAEAREVDLARAHFIDMRWRIACAVAAALFIATVFSALFPGSGWRWPIAMAAAASAGAAIASIAVLWLEARAGRRGRAAVEDSAQEAEASIAESFHSRMRLGADGERRGRRRRWYQTAARTRDAASRLKAVVDIAEIHALRSAAADAPAVPTTARAYAAASTVEISAAALPVEALRDALREDPSGIVSGRRREYEAWWSDSLRREDPLQRGAVLARSFGPKATQAIAGLVDAFRADLLGIVERDGTSADFGWVADGKVARLLGPPGDLRNLGVQTERSIGRNLLRNVWVHLPLRRHARHAADELAVCLGHAVVPLANVAAVDRWGCMGLVVDEIAVGFRAGRAGLMCIDQDGTLCIWEGSDPVGPGRARGGGSTMSGQPVDRKSSDAPENANGEGQSSSFVEESLGIHSSHPSTASRRLWFCGLPRWGVGSAALSYAALAVYRAFAWEQSPLGGALSGLRQAIKSTDTILFALAMALAAVLAAALTIRISRLGTEFAHRPSGRLVLGGSIVALVVATFAACALFGWLATTNSISAVARNRWWVAVVAALPLEALLVFVEFRERRRSGSSLGWLLAALRQVGFAASVAATAMVMTPSVSRSIGSALGGFLKVAGGLLGGLGGLVPGADLLIGMGVRIVEKGLGGFLASTIGLATAMATVAWVTTKVSSIASERTTGAPAPTAPAPRGWFARIMEYVNPLRWLRASKAGEGEGEGEGEVSSAPGGPNWLGSLPAALSSVANGPVRVEFLAAVDPATVADPKDYSSASPESQLELVFDGRPPTTDQADALRLFDDLWLRHSRSLQAAGFGSAPLSHCDLLIQGFPDAFSDPEDEGVLELQVACALVAVVARGQRVLFLVTGDDERDHVLDAVRRRLAALRIDTLYRASSLAANEMGLWAPPAAAPGTVMQERAPDVMVATLGDYEQAFFGGSSAGHVMRALLFDAEVVLVPNLMALTRAPEGRVHFPFIVDKHRLVLASENRTLQLVVGTPPIGERPVPGRGDSADSSSESTDPEVHVALEAVALRLFGGDARLAGHSAILRRRLKSVPARAWIRVPAATVRESVDAVVIHIAGSVGPERVCLVLGREEPRPSAERLKALSVAGGAVSVLHELDVSDGSELGERLSTYDFVVAEGRAGGRLVKEIAARIDPAHATLVEVTSGAPVALARSPQWTVSLPVFPSAESPALALSHLRSAVFHVSDDCLIRRDELVRFGVSWNRARWSAGGAYKTMHEGWGIELDGHADAGIGATSDQGLVWPAAIVRSEVRKERPVMLSAPIERGLALAGEEVLFLAEDGQAPDPRRSARWVGPRGQSLGQVDLAYVSRFVWSDDRQEYRAVALERSAEHGWIIQGHPFHGDGDEPELPAVTISVDIPWDAIGTMLQVRQGENVRVFTICDRGGDSRCASRERIVGLVSRNHRSIVGGRGISAETVTPIGPIEFSVRVGASFVCLGSSEWISHLPPPSAAHDERGSLPDWVRGRWDVGAGGAGEREFSPAFTAAVHRSLHAVAPGILEFSRVAAFRTARSPNGVVIVFIEPHATAGTAAEAMRVVLDDPSLRKRFVGKLIEAIASDTEEAGAPVPVIVTALDAEGLAADLEWAKRLITAIPGGVIDVGAPIGILARDSAAALDESPGFQPAAVPGEGSVHSWNWPAHGADVSLAVEIGVTQGQADEATLSFGWSPPESDPDRLRRGGIRTYEGNRVGPDYSWMIRRSEEVVKPLAARLLSLAERAGASTPRQRVEVFASFVQSFRYQRSAEGRISDGKQRMGVQMPAETLFTRSGDCDSLSVLLVALVRAAGLARGCVILIDDVGGGHAMAAFEVEPRSKKDWCVSVRLRGAAEGRVTFTVVETTAAGWRLGAASTDYHGRYVRLDAVG